MPQTLADALCGFTDALYAERNQLRAEVQRLQREVSQYEAEVRRLHECRDKAASLMHLANQAMYDLT